MPKEPRDIVLVAGLVIGGLIHLLPLAGVLGPAKLRVLYEVDITDRNLDLLLRHRAVLFGILGVLMLAATRFTALQIPALLAGLASAAAFVALAWIVGGVDGALARVAKVDAVAIACMALALVAACLPRGAAP